MQMVCLCGEGGRVDVVVSGNGPMGKKQMYHSATNGERGNVV